MLRDVLVEQLEFELDLGARDDLNMQRGVEIRFVRERGAQRKCIRKALEGVMACALLGDLRRWTWLAWRWD